MLRINKVLIILVLLAAPVVRAAEDRYEVQFGRTLNYRGGRVSVDHRFGPVTVRTEPGNNVTVRATIRASDPAFGQKIRITAVEEGNGVSVRTEFPEERIIIRSGESSYSVDLRITVPPQATLRLTNRFGSIDAEGIGASEITNSHGSIRLRDTRGNQVVENAFGSVDVQDAAGDISIVNSNASVRAVTIAGALNISNRFGSVSVNDVARRVVVKNSNGTVDVRETDGPVSITNSFSNTKVSTIKGAVEVLSQNGRVEVATVGAPVSVRNSFGAVDAKEIAGSLTVNNANGNVSAKEINGDLIVETRFGTVRGDTIRGAARITNANGAVNLTGVTKDARVRTSFSSVFLKEIGGAIDVQNENGAVSVTDLAPPAGGCRPIAVRTTFSSIKLELPADSSYTVNASTSFGHIRSDLPITTRSLGEESVSGTIGRGGACKLELSNTNGNITIDRD